MHIPICHPREIEQTALLLANTILSRRSSLPDVVDHIVATAATQIDYTRSLALIVNIMIDDLLWRNTDLHATFQEELTDVAVATYVDYWANVLGYSTGSKSTRIEYVNPLAISSFIGDLAYLGILDLELFETSLTFLMRRMKSRLHLHCLHMLFAHAGTFHAHQTSPAFIEDCLHTIRHRCIRQLGVFTIEEQLLRQLLDNILLRRPDIHFLQVWDKSLNVEDALMASVLPCPSSVQQQTPSSINARPCVVTP